jgi:predicted phage-related endonuclease
MGQNELTQVIRQLKELKAYREELDAEIEAKEATVKAEMDAQGVEELHVDIFKVIWKTITSHRFDGRAFQASHKDLYEQYVKPSTSRRFSVA